MKVKIIQIEARIAANSGSICKICNEKLDNFNLHKIVHELIRDSLIVTISDILLEGEGKCSDGFSTNNHFGYADRISA